MNPIISPVWVYFIHLSSTIYNLAITVGVLAIIALLMLFLYRIEFDSDDQDDEKYVGHINKYIKICVIVMVICTIILVFIPDEKTMYAMMAASMITPDNISAVEEHIIDLIKEIANAVYNAKK